MNIDLYEKVMFFHIRYRALGPKLISLPLLSAKPAVTFPAKERHRKSQANGITQCYLPHGSDDFPASTTAEDGTEFSDPRGYRHHTNGSVD